MRSYYRIMLGRKNVHAQECLNGNFIGADFGIDRDLSGQLPEEWRQFNKVFIPIYLANHPDKSKIGAGLACGALWTIAKGIKKDDIVLCPDGTGMYHVGKVLGEYYHAPGQILPHRRKVEWLPTVIARSAMSEALQNSTGSIGTVSAISSHQREIEMFLTEDKSNLSIIASDPVIEDPMAFAMEKHLEDFLVQNWDQTDLGRSYRIYEEEGEPVGQQYATDAGPIDILAISKDGKHLLVVELKKGRTSDVVVGQILRYMGYVKEQIAEPDQVVEGAIIASEHDQKMRWALTMTPSISFYRYEITFKLMKG